MARDGGDQAGVRAPVGGPTGVGSRGTRDPSGPFSWRGFTAPRLARSTFTPFESPGIEEGGYGAFSSRASRVQR